MGALVEVRICDMLLFSNEAASFFIFKKANEKQLVHAGK